MSREELQILASEIASQIEYLHKPLLNLDEASRLTNLTKSTLYKKVCAREIPYFKQGKFVLFKRTELESWMMSCRVGSLGEGLTKADSYLKGEEVRHA